MKALFATVLALGTFLGTARGSAGQAPSAPRSPAESSYVASGSTAEEDLSRLRAALAKLPGVEDVSLKPRQGSISVRIKGTALRTLFAAAARSVGYSLRPVPQRSYVAIGHGGAGNVSSLQSALANVEGVEQVEVYGSGGRSTVRVVGDVKAKDLAAAAQSAGFGISGTTYYVAPGPPESMAHARLRESISQVAGVSKVDTRAVGGGALLRIQGLAEDEPLATAARSAGFGLQLLGDPGGGEFGAVGPKTASNRDALRKSLSAIEGIGEIRIQGESNSVRVSVVGGRARQETIIAAGKAAGFELQPVDPDAPFSGPDVERNNPGSNPEDRVLEDLTRVGELAPDFTLMTGDGKGKIGLSEYRGKKPVVLIFGSYT